MNEDSNNQSNLGKKTVGKKLERQIKHAAIHVTEPFKTSEYKRMRRAGYSVSYSNNPQQRKRTKNFRDLLDEFFPDEHVLQTHGALKDSRKIEHMVFPAKMEDKDIAELLESVNCFLRKVVHGEQAKHAYYWAPDNKARKESLDMLYKLKGHYAPEEVRDVTDPLKDLSTEELLKRKKEALGFYKKK